MTRRLLPIALCVTTWLLLVAPSAEARPGGLDPSFGEQGIVRSEFGPSFNRIAFTALDPRPDGSLLAALKHGSEGSAWIRRYEADGNRDQAYGERWTNEPPEAVQADGKALKVDCGSSLVRFEADGTTPDPTFGDLPCGSHKKSDEVPFGIERIVPLASGDILVAGPRSHVVMGAEEPEYVFEQLAIARFHEDGTLDASFGGDGVVLLSTDAGLTAKRLLGVVPRPGGGAVVLAADAASSGYAPTAEHSGSSLLGLTAAGGPDPAYGEGGIAHLDSLVTDFKALGTGRILLAGDAWGAPVGAGAVRDSALFTARYEDDGRLDPTFGNEGISWVEFGGLDLAGALLVAGDGSLFIGGSTTAMSGSYCLRFQNYCEEAPVLAKRTPNGLPDLSFAEAGKLKLESLAYAYGSRSGGVGVQALAERADGDVVAGGGSGTVAFLATMSQSGALDGTFGTGGIVAEQEPQASSDTGNSLGVDRQGRILVAGGTSAGLTERFPTSAVFRYRPNGALDPSWGSGLGYVRVPAAARISVAPSGSAIAARASSPITITKLRASGEIDTSFGEVGTTELRPDTVDVGRLSSIALLPNGEVVVAADGIRHHSQRIVVVRLRRDGRPNRMFGKGGVQILGFGRNHRCSVAQMAVQRDGRIVLAGYVNGLEHEKHHETLAVMRLSLNGSPDPSFGRRGLTTLRIGRRSAATAVAIGVSGEILAGGRSWNGPKSTELLLRLHADGTLDRRFGRRGVVRTPVPRKARGLNGPRTILIAGDRIVTVRDTRDRQVRAFFRNGKLDRSFPQPGALESRHAQAAPPAALQDGKLLILERHYGFPSSFSLRRLLLR